MNYIGTLHHLLKIYFDEKYKTNGVLEMCGNPYLTRETIVFDLGMI